MDTVPAVIATLAVLYAARRLLQSPPRPSKIPRTQERVLVLGASSGIGASIAVQYAQRGAWVCVVGRGLNKLDAVVERCEAASQHAGFQPAVKEGKRRTMGVVADFANVDDMVKLREDVEAEWGGLDTLIVAAGVSALQPIMAIAGVQTTPSGPQFIPSQATTDGMKSAVNIAEAAMKGNFTGPLVSAITFIPLLSSSSLSPSILLISSVAAVVPAPTRGLYCSSKSASLQLYRSLRIEHPAISFSFLLPGTVEGDFRASAVDAGPVREADPNKNGLKREDVARRAIRAVDWQEKDVFMGMVYQVAQVLYWVFPSVVEQAARKKYNWK